MKTIKLTIVAVLLAGIIPAVKAGDPIWATKIKAQRVNVQERSVVFASSAPENEKGFDKCRKYKSKQVAGFVLLPVSLGMMAGGAYMIYTGAKNIVDATSVGIEGVSTDVTKEDKMLLGIGAGLGFAGAVLFPTGLILGIKGGTNYNRDCRGGPGTARSLNLRPTGNGLSMALKF